jgi:ATP/maltotriose-dependent transcriptional regulator MalT/DNA-binding SARP family transcriptional activator
MPGPDLPVDTQRERSVSFARPTMAGLRLGPGERSPIPVGPGRTSTIASQVSGAHRDDVSGFPIQYAKVQPPPLREETLARHRLLDWLAAKINQRVVLLLADAGYGKTTLLADFSGRTRLRTMWYRLDDDDRDWISVLNHLVAAGREVDPAFAPNTAAMLADPSLGGPTRDTVVDVFIRELRTIAPYGAVLIFDDFHLVDDAPDVQFIARELVARAPERLTIVFASRRAPTIPIARLRATGEVAELTTDDLRFDPDETDRLFREAYGRDLEPDVLADVAARTEGWAASLQLVNAALRDRSPSEIRAFVRGLSGADHDLYDYLAEEVVGDLAEDLQSFLMRTSILQIVTPDLAEVVSGLETSETARLTVAAERITLLSRRSKGQRRELRYHPLVREFLEARLTRDVGLEAVRALHRTVAVYAEGLDWRIAAHHHWAAGDRHRALEIIDDAAQSIIGRGDYLVAAQFVDQAPEEDLRASFHVVLSRRDFKLGDIRGALARAKRAVETDPTSDIALANLASLMLTLGEAHAAVDAAHKLLVVTKDPVWLGIAEGTLAAVADSVDGNVGESVVRLRELAEQQRERGQTHFEGITYLNLAETLRTRGLAIEALEAANRSMELLQGGSGATEVATSRAIAAWAYLHLGQVEKGWAELDLALREPHKAIHADALKEAAQMEARYGSSDRATEHLEDLQALGEEADWARIASTPTAAYLAIRRGDTGLAKELIEVIDPDTPTEVSGQKAHVLAVRAHVHVVGGTSDASLHVESALRHSLATSAGLWHEYGLALRAICAGDQGLRQYVRSTVHRGSWALTYVAELVAQRLDLLSDAEHAIVLQEALVRPERWRPALRVVVDDGEKSAIPAARFLELVGDSEDIGRLRRIAHRHKGKPEAELGRALSRRVAAPVYVEDQGRVAIHVGDRMVDGSNVRRKVLALLCFLLTRPGYAATRDEVMEALWPEFDPADALNSLNQTVYFLRRVFEPAYKDDLSPGYVHHESDVIWLDTELINSRSRACLEHMQTMGPNPTPDEVLSLSRAYRGSFALDFAYEEWASDYRVSLHSRYLQIVEGAVAGDMASGHFERGILIARRALDLSPEADQIELSLLRLYRLTGSHAAAAEQYAHYSAVMRDHLGLEPPALESL